MIDIVLGALYGDEGKGQTVHNLALTGRYSTVVRFNGGNQAGHTVEYQGKRHVFSHFGSGTLAGLPTFWSRFCPIDILAFLTEYNALVELDTTPIFIADPLCPIILPWDRILQQSDDNMTCGTGYGSCMKREEETPYHLTLVDLYQPRKFLEQKIKYIIDYYYKDFNELRCNEILNSWLDKLDDFKNKIILSKLDNFNDNVIFEGAQGIKLDQQHGIFPFVTRSNTTCKNAISLIKSDSKFRINYIVRWYETRHGFDPTFYQEPALNSLLPEDKTNIYNQYQGEFRRRKLNIDNLQSSIMINESYCSTGSYERKLIITHMNEINDNNRNYYPEKELQELNIEKEYRD